MAYAINSLKINQSIQTALLLSFPNQDLYFFRDGVSFKELPQASTTANFPLPLLYYFSFLFYSNSSSFLLQ
jgi:hypothetical protein